MKRILFSLTILSLFSIVITSCSIGRPIVTEKSQNNQSYTVSYLFEHDGCKVYRFWDDGKYVYFTNCTGNTSVPSSDSTNVSIQNTIYKALDKK